MAFMRSLNLHTKTTVLASAITLTVLGAALALVSVRVADIVDKEQRSRAQLLVINFADQISHMPVPRDPQLLAQSATLMRGAHPDIVAVRVWQRVGGVYKVAAEAAGSAPAENLPDETIDALRSGLDSRIIKTLPKEADSSLYRVAAPITDSTNSSNLNAEEKRFSGAVELIERLDDAPLIARGFERTAVWMALAAVLIITLAVYLLFRQIVYRPIERLLFAMSRAESGDLSVAALLPPRPPDELGQLTRGFNRMIERVREMTEEREARAGLLQERVHEATAELERRNNQLEEINLELWQTTRRLTELERLAAAGQTAAQFAHEVGTPLNLISGHVQLLRAHLINDARADTRLETISAQIERIERIVRRMLDRTRPEAVSLVPVDIHALLLRTFETTAPTLESRGVHLDTTHLATQLPRVKGDADRLQQVFINLINNALDAMPEGGELRVSAWALSAEESKGRKEKSITSKEKSVEGLSVFVEFADTGCGITADVRAHIFDAFYTTKEKGRGTGLGLFVVRQVMREHGGEIEAESDTQCGARFRLKLPAMENTDLLPPSPTTKRVAAPLQSIRT
ncbi:MAG: sensor histidine kinase [Pyrinomonadaceae bacterium]